MNEFDWINAFRARMPAHPRVPLGIGDDAAIVSSASGDRLAMAVDTLIEGVHFVFDENPDYPPATPELAGRKALAVNLSDLAAMAAHPLAAVVGVVFDRRRGADFASRVMNGVRELAEEFDMAIVGGDTNTWNGPLMISVTVLGESATPMITRNGSQVGDLIGVTGPLGGSRFGHHLKFTPRIRESHQLRTALDIHAMIDVSDGLSSDLRHLLDAANVGARVEAEAIPLKPECDHWQNAFEDGEDFELLFTVAASDGPRLPTCKVPIHVIGTIEEPSVQELIVAGVAQPFPDGGWNHRFD
ncbi:thiamine-phosphate kinase [Thalassoroseus pseudoceratinae]|uniref:thiamine-phosphate kinase n=1 Tax=Thalassoroseus pseudoceratinae TaxID=2713176 RepID=UPI0014200A13|nr:thiamine-phosphate kinase [Thalassoroseus pseudoceratinae]